MGQKCCRCVTCKNADKAAAQQQEREQAAARVTTSPLAPSQAQRHPHRSMAGDLITCRTARKLDIRDAAIEDYVHL